MEFRFYTPMDRPFFAVSGACRRLILLLLAIGLVNGYARADDTARVNRVKAAVILNIARFVSWPEGVFIARNERMQLCLYRDSPIDQALATIAGEEITGHPIELRHVRSLKESNSCHILLINQGELSAYLKEAPDESDSPLLTIADLTDIQSSMNPRHDILVSLIRNGARIGFEINLERARRKGLRMSSELLKLAIIVGDGS